MNAIWEVLGQSVLFAELDPSFVEASDWPLERLNPIVHKLFRGDLVGEIRLAQQLPWFAAGHVFRPVLDGAGEVHVDGGVLNNLPVDRARALSAGG